MKIQVFALLALMAVALFSDCKKKKEESPEPYVSFTVGGITYMFRVASSFNKICLLSGYCGTFSQDAGQPDRNVIFLGVPASVKTGALFQTGDTHFEFIYHSPGGKTYNSYYGGHMQVHITLWQGNGGWVHGTFSGTLPVEGNPSQDSVIIQNGKFEGKIWYIQTD